MTIDRATAQAFDVTLNELHNPTQHTPACRARQVYAYMLVQFLPLPERFPARGGKTRAAGDQDGNGKRVARMLGVQPNWIRHTMRRVEELREDPEFDALLTRLEERLATLDAAR